ncbi:hypothetical protein P4T62_28470 [Bacillus mycoides]|uniref:hypothetical protein n=1 Tax=Bacillus mycoides TaxID=1405 RepID=UPI002E1E1BDD|nr:hypothetical protein [Bacillus mycoides]
MSEKKIYGRTVRADGKVALTILCEPDEDKDILEYFQNRPLGYITKEAVRDWIRKEEQRKISIQDQLNPALLTQLLQSVSQNEQAAAQQIQPIPQEIQKPTPVLSTEAGKNFSINDF